MKSFGFDNNTINNDYICKHNKPNTCMDCGLNNINDILHVISKLKLKKHIKYDSNDLQNMEYIFNLANIKYNINTNKQGFNSFIVDDKLTKNQLLRDIGNGIQSGISIFEYIPRNNELNSDSNNDVDSIPDINEDNIDTLLDCFAQKMQYIDESFTELNGNDNDNSNILREKQITYFENNLAILKQKHKMEMNALDEIDAKIQFERLKEQRIETLREDVIKLIMKLDDKMDESDNETNKMDNENDIIKPDNKIESNDDNESNDEFDEYKLPILNDPSKYILIVCNYCNENGLTFDVAINKDNKGHYWVNIIGDDGCGNKINEFRSNNNKITALNDTFKNYMFKLITSKDLLIKLINIHDNDEINYKALVLQYAYSNNIKAPLVNINVDENELCHIKVTFAQKFKAFVQSSSLIDGENIAFKKIWNDLRVAIV